MFSSVMVFGSLEACRPSANLARPVPAPPALSVPAPVLSNPTLPLPSAPVLPAPVLEPVPRPGAENAWKPVAEARDWTSIVIHHTATDQGSVESIHETHIAREWLGIGYHFVIGNGNGMDDGEIEPTFRWREQLHGAHAGSDEYNQQGIGIALIGNFDEQPPTPAQLAAVKRLVAVLKTEYEIDSEHVIGHSEVKATLCPGKLFPMSEVSEVDPADMAWGTMQRTASLAAPLRTFRAVQNGRSAASVRVPLAVLSGSRLP